MTNTLIAWVTGETKLNELLQRIPKDTIAKRVYLDKW